MSTSAEDLARGLISGQEDDPENAGTARGAGAPDGGAGAGAGTVDPDDEEDTRTPEQIREDERKLKDRLKALAPFESIAGVSGDPDAMRRVQAAALGIETGVRERVIEREAPRSQPAPEEEREEPVEVTNKRFYDAAIGGTLGNVLNDEVDKRVAKAMKKASAGQVDYGPQLAQVRLESFETKIMRDEDRAELFQAAKPYWAEITSKIDRAGLAKMDPAMADAALEAALDLAIGQTVRNARTKMRASGQLNGRREETRPPQMGTTNRGSGSSGTRAPNRKVRIDDIPSENVRVGRNAGLTDAEIVDAFIYQQELEAEGI